MKLLESTSLNTIFSDLLKDFAVAIVVLILNKKLIIKKKIHLFNFSIFMIVSTRSDRTFQI